MKTKTKMKNLITSALMLLAMLLPATATADQAYDFEVDGIYYVITGDEVTVSCKEIGEDACSAIPYYYSDYSGNVDIPSTVTVIDRGVEGCFHNCPLTHIDIPDCVHTIGWGCFSGVPLEEVKLPSKLRRLGGYAFDGTKLKSVVVPEGLTSMGSRVFGGDSLVQVDLPSTLLCIEGLPMNDERWKESEAVLICRALSPPYVKEGGVFIAMKGPAFDEELEAAIKSLREQAKREQK